jgi:hypothetical protein
MVCQQRLDFFVQSYIVAARVRQKAGALGCGSRQGVEEDFLGAGMERRRNWSVPDLQNLRLPATGVWAVPGSGRAGVRP